MASETEKLFISESAKRCRDIEKKAILEKNLNHFYKKWENSKSGFSNLAYARKKLHYAKFRSIENLEKNLIEFEAKFCSRGGKMFFAAGKDEALKYILDIVQQSENKKIVKSKSMVCEEIQLEKFLNLHNIHLLETDLGEFLVQLANESPSHITAPALHKSKKEIYELLNEKYDQVFDESTPVEAVVQFVRNLLREDFSSAGIGITGCNFMIADPGVVAICENEANAILSASFPKTHIIVTSIEKIIHSFDQLELFQTMLSSHATGQNMTVYNHLVFGPAAASDKNGPEKVYLVVINNNRTEIMKSVQMRQAMYCIKCGACHNFCPVYSQIGGHAYQTVYNGPIGSVISPYIFGEYEFAYLPFASTLCGKCNTVCPVDMNITSLLIHKRKHIVDNKYNSSSERRLFNKLQRKLLKRKRMDGSVFLKNTVLRTFLKKSWGKEREIPVIAKQSFCELKKKEKKKKT